METTYTSDSYNPSLVRRKLVRANLDGTYTWCEVGDDTRYDLRQGRIDGSELPNKVRGAADKLAGKHFGFTLWE